jgi:hypothetical protein
MWSVSSSSSPDGAAWGWFTTASRSLVETPYCTIPTITFAVSTAAAGSSHAAHPTLAAVTFPTISSDAGAAHSIAASHASPAAAATTCSTSPASFTSHTVTIGSWIALHTYSFPTEATSSA